MYLLDTNIVSAAIRGSAEVDARLLLLESHEWCISAVTRAELRYGLAKRPEARKLAQVVERFLQLATTLAWDTAAADAHGRLRAQLHAAGTPIGEFDTMIAAHALALGATVVTDNVSDFGRVRDLQLENWLRD
ncbi:type II toxin-antitoxin system VapC family toxin [Variovorax sp. VNK109]|jgi:tRNA(fMet)-specific endonuclease VapC|uniref:type II toxin-antitoxin system VapC family toxin n=1 Tax=Variovorax sp. VNK109 TaxID=3400919 RepID=UPI003C08E154